MPRKPNYNFEKRLKESAKQQKKADKRQRKRMKRDGEPPEDTKPDQGAASSEGAPSGELS